MLGNEQNPETEGCVSPHKLRKLIIQRINHLSDQLAVESLRLFNALLHLSYQPIIETLIIRNFKQRSYLDLKKVDFQKNTPYSTYKSSNNKVNEPIKKNTNQENPLKVLNKESKSENMSDKIETIVESSNEFIIKTLQNNNIRIKNEEKVADLLGNCSEQLVNDDRHIHSQTFESAYNMAEEEFRMTPNVFDGEFQSAVEKHLKTSIDSDELSLSIETTNESINFINEGEVNYSTLGESLDEICVGSFNKKRVEKTVNG